VAQKSVLVCDLAHARVKYALVTRKFVVELDLCRVHDKDVLSGKAVVIPKGFLKLMKKAREVKQPKVAKHKKATRRVGKVDYEMLAAQVLGYASRINKPFNAAMITKALKLSSPSTGHRICLKLIEDGKLKSVGNGPSRKLELATPKSNGKAAA
jgi:hypothetical protein